MFNMDLTDFKYSDEGWKDISGKECRTAVTTKMDGSQLCITVNKDGSVSYTTKSMKDPSHFFKQKKFEHLVKEMLEMLKRMDRDSFTIVFEFMGTNPCKGLGVLETKTNVLVAFEFILDEVNHHIHENSEQAKQIREMLSGLDNVEVVPLVLETTGLATLTLPAMLVELIGIWKDNPRLEGFMVTFFNGVKFVTVKIKSFAPLQKGSIMKNLIKNFSTNKKVSNFFRNKTDMVLTVLENANKLILPTEDDFAGLNINQMFILVNMILSLMRKRMTANQAKTEVTLENLPLIINPKRLSEKEAELTKKKEPTEEEKRLLKEIQKLPLQRKKKKEKKTPDGPPPREIQIIIDNPHIKTREEVINAIKALKNPQLMKYIRNVMQMKKS
jgi:hypothetical protein